MKSTFLSENRLEKYKHFEMVKFGIEKKKPMAWCIVNGYGNFILSIHQRQDGQVSKFREHGTYSPKILFGCQTVFGVS